MQPTKYKKVDPRKLPVAIVYFMAFVIMFWGIGMVEILRQEYVSDYEDWTILTGMAALFVICAGLAWVLCRWGNKMRANIRARPWGQQE